MHTRTLEQREKELFIKCSWRDRCKRVLRGLWWECSLSLRSFTSERISYKGADLETRQITLTLFKQNKVVLKGKPWNTSMWSCEMCHQPALSLSTYCLFLSFLVFQFYNSTVFVSLLSCCRFQQQAKKFRLSHTLTNITEHLAAKEPDFSLRRTWRPNQS